MEYGLHFNYQQNTQGYLYVHGADQQNPVGNYEVNTHIIHPINNQAPVGVPCDNWCSIPRAYANGPSPCEGPPVYCAEQGPDLLHLHAPIPMLGRAPLLRSSSYYSSEVRISAREERSVPQLCESDEDQSITQVDPNHLPHSQPAAPSHSTFLTPSELLVATRKPPQEPPVPCLGRDCDNTAPTGSPLPTYTEHPVADAMATPNPSTTSLTLNHSDMAQETITPHEKKRCYLECLEQYVAFLHEHCRFVGFEPPPIQRIPSYRGLDNRSIRTLLIHMEKLAQQMKERIFQEEQRFVTLRDALQQQEAATQAIHGARHDV